ncbi:2,3-dehydroadipyl-CoA hydratase (plasmid) [Variovorax sp. WDL1]|nr:2,3-dehydroadipyl-CoA hydratase [Variovorax sp. B2]PNG46263.1 2,3-dehydroadipyl-CoA hydratase [Variovorax sp. B4]VTV19191.1 2,3-dehydroadipyl-CoA hydratase [Variovorax sp. WDL1]
MVQAIADSDVLVIAAVEEAAAGAGLSLVLGCDLVVAGASSRFAMSHVRVGLSPDAGGNWWAAHHMPRQAAAELLLEGTGWPVSRMHALGLVNEITTDGHALEAALSLAAQFQLRSPHAVARIKALLRGARNGSDLMAQRQAKKESFLDCLAHADSGEAISAFLEKRAPRFQPPGD